MKLAQVIGKVTLNHFEPSLKGGRFLLISPLSQTQIATLSQSPHARETLQPLSGEFTPVLYDELGAGENDIIAYVEGGEAMMPFDFPIPIDAYNVAILNTLSYTPEKTA